ncbi:MAG: FkbM family methyltransferase [Sedimentisphaerales bacterium]|nr:FkbM family methyltransferase [Sedimentisphaerales bacterium]
MRKFLKKQVRKAFNVCGFELTRMWAARRLGMAQVLDHIIEMDFQPESVIDVGVADGTYDLYRAFPQARFLLIEPLAECEKYLQKIIRHYNAEYILACAADQPGSTILNVHPDITGSSMAKEQEGAHADGIEREVPVITIDQVCAERNLTGPFVMKIDTQGTELNVLDGAAKTLLQTELVILEVQFFETMIGGPQFYKVVTYMKKHGFVAYDCFGNAYRPLDGALTAMDIVFVKENGFFRKSHAFATEHQREQMKKIFVRKRPVPV